MNKYRSTKRTTDYFYCVDKSADGNYFSYKISIYDFVNINNYYNSNNMFKTKKQADEKLRIMNIIKENKMNSNEIDEIIASDQLLFYIRYDIAYNRAYATSTFDDVANTDYFKTREIAQEVVEKCGQDSLKKYYFGVWEE